MVRDLYELDVDDEDPDGRKILVPIGQGLLYYDYPNKQFLPLPYSELQKLLSFQTQSAVFMNRSDFTQQCKILVQIQNGVDNNLLQTNFEDLFVSSQRTDEIIDIIIEQYSDTIVDLQHLQLIKPTQDCYVIYADGYLQGFDKNKIDYDQMIQSNNKFQVLYDQNMQLTVEPIPICYSLCFKTSDEKLYQQQFSQIQLLGNYQYRNGFINCYRSNIFDLQYEAIVEDKIKIQSQLQHQNIDYSAQISDVICKKYGLYYKASFDISQIASNFGIWYNSNLNLYYENGQFQSYTTQQVLRKYITKLLQNKYFYIHNIEMGNFSVLQDSIFQQNTNRFQIMPKLYENLCLSNIQSLRVLHDGLQMNTVQELQLPHKYYLALDNLNKLILQKEAFVPSQSGYMSKINDNLQAQSSFSQAEQQNLNIEYMLKAYKQDMSINEGKALVVADDCLYYTYVPNLQKQEQVGFYYFDASTEKITTVPFNNLFNKLEIKRYPNGKQGNTPVVMQCNLRKAKQKNDNIFYEDEVMYLDYQARCVNCFVKNTSLTMNNIITFGNDNEQVHGFLIIQGNTTNTLPSFTNTYQQQFFSGEEHINFEGKKINDQQQHIYEIFEYVPDQTQTRQGIALSQYALKFFSPGSSVTNDLQESQYLQDLMDQLDDTDVIARIIPKNTLSNQGPICTITKSSINIVSSKVFKKNITIKQINKDYFDILTNKMKIKEFCYKLLDKGQLSLLDKYDEEIFKNEQFQRDYHNHYRKFYGYIIEDTLQYVNHITDKSKKFINTQAILYYIILALKSYDKTHLQQIEKKQNKNYSQITQMFKKTDYINKKLIQLKEDIIKKQQQKQQIQLQSDSQ